MEEEEIRVLAWLVVPLGRSRGRSTLGSVLRGVSSRLMGSNQYVPFSF